MTTLSPPLSPQNSHQSRPRPTTQTSYRSHRSWRSSTSGNKMDLTETERDKRRLQAKSDPTQALREAQPAAIALEDSNLENLRASQHKDTEGNVITDPDRSNPTRHRLERPLDTIRSFNAAAEGTSYRRSSYNQQPSPNLNQGSFNDGRRSSYYGSNPHGQHHGRPRPGQGGYYRNGSYGFRPDHHQEDMYQQNIPYGRPPRQQSQQYYEESHGSNNSYGQSYETMTSGSDEYGKSTNPSSQNSSFDRLHQLPRKPEEYGHAEYDGQQGPPTPQSLNHSPYSQQQAYYSQHPQQYSQQTAPPPPPPQAAVNNPRKPIRLNSGYNNSQYQSQSRPVAKNEKPLPAPKRQSWIKRAFSLRES